MRFYDVTFLVASLFSSDQQYETHPIHKSLESGLKYSERDRETLRVLYVIGIDFDDERWLQHRAEFMSTYQNKHKNIDFQMEVLPEEFSGEPCYIWNGLLKKYYHNSEYFFQLGDDITFHSDDFLSKMISNLKQRKCANFGVVGAVEHDPDLETRWDVRAHPRWTPKYLEQLFFHRRHFDVFGYLFPPEYKNWSSDVWVTEVYEKISSCTESWARLDDVKIYNNLYADNEGRNTYEADKTLKEDQDLEKRLIEKGKDSARDYLKRECPCR